MDKATIFSLVTTALGIIACYAVYLFMDRRRQKKANAGVQIPQKMLDDTSYIQEMKHLYGKVGFVVWQQYDFLLATQHYGWETMVDWAAYMESADIDKIDSIVVADMTEDSDVELAHVYNQTKGGLKNFERMAEERGSLSIAGHSRTLNESVKIGWFNQTRVLRVFTLINDETLITRYVETAIRRTFGTKDAMKLAQPVEL